MKDPLYYLQKYFKKDSFRDNQLDIINAICSGKDVMAVMPTGSGKSICYQLPALMLKGVTIVVSPLIALMHDQVANLNKQGIKAEYLSGDMDPKEKYSILRDMADDEEESCKLLYVSPEKLTTPKFLRFVQHINIQRLIIDEAHCVSLWGYDFRISYMNIAKFVHRLDKRPVIAAFTATASEFIRNDVINALELQEPFIVSGGYSRSDLTLSIRNFTDKTYKYKSLYNILGKHIESYNYAIVYCATPEIVDEVHSRLEGKKEFKGKTAKYHGKMKTVNKNENFSMFKNGERKIMVATNAFGMGIDINDIRLIIHFCMPKDPESYYQEIGRAGRNSAPNTKSECILFYCKTDFKICDNLLMLSKENSKFDEKITESRYNLGKKRLKIMEKYARLPVNTSSEKLNKFFEDYFLKSNISVSEQNIIKKEQKQIEEYINKIDIVYMNTTKVANIIRKGDYEINKPQTVTVTKKNHYTVFEISQRLTYFDMMVADAVYTLEVMNVETIHPKNILQLLSGDENIMPKPDYKKQIDESLEKMMNTHIKIDRSRSKYAFNFDSEKNINILEGNFLPLKKWGKNGYKYSVVPPLYRYAELNNGRFFTFPDKKLRITENGKKVISDTLENLEIKYYIAWRVTLSDWKRLYYRKTQTLKSSIIKFIHNNKKRKGLFDTLDISFPEDKYMLKRKKKTICEKIDKILKYYKNIHIISDYKFENNGELVSKINGEETGVYLDFNFYDYDYDSDDL